MDQQLYSTTHGKNGGSPIPTPGPAQTSHAPFSIKLRFADGMDDGHADAFKRAANRWTRVIQGGLSPVEIDGEVIEGILILADVGTLDGPRGDLAEAYPTHLRPDEAEYGAGLPARAEMLFDRADLERLARNGMLEDVVAHEMGHALGIGISGWFKMVKQEEGGDRKFHGPRAMREYATLLGSRGGAEPVPIDAGAHWRESITGNELMSGAIFGKNNRLSRLTVGSLHDLGYDVRYEAAEPYQLPSADSRPALESLGLGSAARYHSCRSVRRSVARILPKSALVQR